MKKLFLFFAVASIFVACNKPAEKVEENQDSIATEVVASTVDSLGVAVDSLSVTVDSLAAVK